MLIFIKSTVPYIAEWGGGDCGTLPAGCVSSCHLSTRDAACVCVRMYMMLLLCLAPKSSIVLPAVRAFWCAKLCLVCPIPSFFSSSWHGYNTLFPFFRKTFIRKTFIRCHFRVVRIQINSTAARRLGPGPFAARALMIYEWHFMAASLACSSSLRRGREGGT